MKVGSLVECIIQRSFYDWGTNHDSIKNIPVKGKIYTVREFCNFSGIDGVYVEELCIGYTEIGEIGMLVEDYRELHIPPAIEEEISEMLTKELELELV